MNDETEMISFDKFYKKYDLIRNMSTILLKTYSDNEASYSMLVETLNERSATATFYRTLCGKGISGQKSTSAI